MSTSGLLYVRPGLWAVTGHVWEESPDRTEPNVSLARQTTTEGKGSGNPAASDRPPPRGDASIQGSFRNTDMTGTLKEVLFMYNI